jgi:hypothetical protein
VMPAPDLALRRLPGATGDHPAIAAFVAELRAILPSRPNLTEEHAAFITNVLANAHHAAADDPELLDLWDDLVAVIRRRDRTVRERLAEFGRIGELFDQRRRGRAN